MNGLLVVNKPKNYTSRDVVNVLNKVFNTKVIGHIGTLDPLATGVLVCLIGKYTKLNNLLTMHNKEYIADFKLGILTDTLDATGRVLDTSNKFIKKEKLVRALKKFKKTYMQEVPMYSAIKVNGRKLYDYARHDEEVVPPKKMVTIYDIELLDYEYDDVKIRCTVSKGTYIRALIRDICRYLKTYGVNMERYPAPEGFVEVEKPHNDYTKSSWLHELINYYDNRPEMLLLNEKEMIEKWKSYLDKGEPLPNTFDPNDPKALQNAIKQTSYYKDHIFGEDK